MHDTVQPQSITSLLKVLNQVRDTDLASDKTGRNESGCVRQLVALSTVGRHAEIPRHVDDEDTTLAGFVAQRERAAVRLDRHAADRKAQAQAAAICAPLLEGLENRVGTGRESAALVLDFDRDAIRRRA